MKSYYGYTRDNDGAVLVEIAPFQAVNQRVAEELHLIPHEGVMIVLEQPEFEELAA